MEVRRTVEVGVTPRGLAVAEWSALLTLSLAVVGLAVYTVGTRGVAFEHRPAEEPAEPYRLLVDINRDPWQRLTLVRGIGERTAKLIVEHREMHGPFRSIDELSEIHGIGPRRLEQWRPYLKPIEPDPRGEP